MFGLRKTRRPRTSCRSMARPSANRIDEVGLVGRRGQQRHRRMGGHDEILAVVRRTAARRGRRGEGHRLKEAATGQWLRDRTFGRVQSVMHRHGTPPVMCSAADSAYAAMATRLQLARLFGSLHRVEHGSPLAGGDAVQATAPSLSAPMPWCSAPTSGWPTATAPSVEAARGHAGRASPAARSPSSARRPQVLTKRAGVAVVPAARRTAAVRAAALGFGHPRGAVAWRRGTGALERQQ